jgi:hypothetical protein
MNIFERAGLSWPELGKQSLVSLLSLALLFATWPQQALAYQDAKDQAPAQATQQAPPGTAAQAPPYTQQTADQLQQLVAPIALYADSLVAQILAAATFPEQVVEADRWVQANPDLKGDALGKAVDQQPWDPSVKALTAFPSVLGNMDKNLSWTSSLGDAYYNQQQDVMDAVQVMRKRAEDAGNLKTTPQQTVSTQGSTVVIQPASPDVVYVPAYDPWLVYGGPVYPWPGWYPYPGIWFGGPYLSFGLGFGIGWFGGFGWGWGHWGFNWHGGYPIYGGRRYYSVSRTFYNRSNFYRGGAARGGFKGARGGFNGARGGVYNQHGAVPRPFNGNSQAARGYAERGNTQAARGYSERSGESGIRSNAFSGYDHGGQARSFSSRGSSSFGGGGFHGGGGGAHGGGGGGRR